MLSATETQQIKQPETAATAQKQTPKIRLVGWSKDPIEIAELEINVETEGYVWLHMIGKDGKEYQTGLLKETT